VLFGRKTIVVHTRPELDQAVANTQARQIVVDGDNELLSYAEQVVNPQSENLTGATWEFGAHRLSVSEKEAPPLSLYDREIGLASGDGVVETARSKVPIKVLLSLIFLAAALLLLVLCYCYWALPPPRGRLSRFLATCHSVAWTSMA
jgi:hypothetical protein